MDDVIFFSVDNVKLSVVMSVLLIVVDRLVSTRHNTQQGFRRRCRRTVMCLTHTQTVHNPKIRTLFRIKNSGLPRVRGALWGEDCSFSLDEVRWIFVEQKKAKEGN